jgi:hypothetical protein
MEMFEYVAVLTSIIIGLGMAQLLLGLTRLIQNPERAKPYWIHLGWVLYMFIFSVFWWWWEFRLGTIMVWTFGVYLFVILYAFLVFLLCALLFPTSFSGHDGFKGYFYAKRAWFFSTQFRNRYSWPFPLLRSLPGTRSFTRFLSSLRSRI